MRDERIRELNDKPARKAARYVLYWMQQSQRADFNPALEYAVREGNRLKQPVIVAFGLMDDYPEADARHYAFMLDGLDETAESVESRGMRFCLRRGAPDDIAIELAADAATVVCDRGYLRHQLAWRKRLAAEAGCRVVEIEGDVIVPVEVASDKKEHAARTLRPKIQRCLQRFLVETTQTTVGARAVRLRVSRDARPGEFRKLLDTLTLEGNVEPVSRFKAGTAAARAHLERFLRGALNGYADARNDPADPQCSNLSPYLHFGQISPVEIALKTLAAKNPGEEDRTAYLDELIVRRELAVNYVTYEPDYDKYSALPEWARQTLDDHRGDEREHRYTRREMETAGTHDRYFNAAMREARKTGYMHNYMRMYWGKKIIQWSNTPEYAFRTALTLNNRWFLDGRDPNSYANVAWLFGQHDRGWTERPVFGKVRYMNAAGLERKFDIDAYVAWVDTLGDA